IGSDEMVSINELVSIVADVAGKAIFIEHVPGPQGVRGRRSDNRLIQKIVGWQPEGKLIEGIERTYPWVEQQLHSGDYQGKRA
ncbi:MAG: NAD-dependent dehydratase, partial [Candidatus Puniceispirillaceae bacterium]